MLIKFMSSASGCAGIKSHKGDIIFICPLLGFFYQSFAYSFFSEPAAYRKSQNICHCLKV